MSEIAPFREKGCLTGGCSTCGICLATEQEEAMTTQTHTVSTDALATLGTIIDERAGRDAIHLAVEPVIAGFDLVPGQDVGIDEGVAKPRRPFLGIVDPFLTKTVKKGERFWLVVYPRQITSLRHVWEHPAFADETRIAGQGESIKERSETWLREFINRSDCPPYEEVIAKALNNNETWSSEYLHFNDMDAHGEIPPEFWDHVEVVTGVKIEARNRAEYFSCSC